MPRKKKFPFKSVSNVTEFHAFYNVHVSEDKFDNDLNKLYLEKLQKDELGQRVASTIKSENRWFPHMEDPNVAQLSAKIINDLVKIQVAKLDSSLLFKAFNVERIAISPNDYHLKLHQRLLGQNYRVTTPTGEAVTTYTVGEGWEVYPDVTTRTIKITVPAELLIRRPEDGGLTPAALVRYARRLLERFIAIELTEALVNAITASPALWDISAATPTIEDWRQHLALVDGKQSIVVPEWVEYKLPTDGMGPALQDATYKNGFAVIRTFDGLPLVRVQAVKEVVYDGTNWVQTYIFPADFMNSMWVVGNTPHLIRLYEGNITNLIAGGRPQKQITLIQPGVDGSTLDVQVKRAWKISVNTSLINAPNSRVNIMRIKCA